VKRSSSLKRRVRDIEEARGAGALSLVFADGSKEGFYLERNDCLEVLLASFEIARAAHDPAAPPPENPRAIAVARAVARAEEVRPHSALWDTVGAIVRGAEEDERNCTNHAPGLASDSF
jgi:hypothetical protein